MTSQVTNSVAPEVPLVFLDTCIHKAAARVTMFGKKTRIHNERGEWTGVHVPIIDYSYNERIRNDNQRHEHELVSDVARMFLDGRLRAAYNMEFSMEFMLLPKSCGGPSLFRGVDWEYLSSPITMPINIRLTKWHEDFRTCLDWIRDDRFDEIKRMVGAFQGERPAPFNQLVDAFAVWVAEHGGCRFFLTVDRKLRRYRFRSDSLQFVLPSELLKLAPPECASDGEA